MRKASQEGQEQPATRGRFEIVRAIWGVLESRPIAPETLADTVGRMADAVLAVQPAPDARGAETAQGVLRRVWQALGGVPGLDTEPELTVEALANVIQELLVRASPRLAGGGEALDALADEVHAWQLETFPHATASSKAEHLRREAIELAETPDDPEEIADVWMLLMGIVKKTGIDLAAAVRAKLSKNRAREWGKPDEHGVVEHVRPSPAPETTAPPPFVRNESTPEARALWATIDQLAARATASVQGWRSPEAVGAETPGMRRNWPLYLEGSFDRWSDAKTDAEEAAAFNALYQLAEGIGRELDAALAQPTPASVCPYVRSSDEGTSYCALAVQRPTPAGGTGEALTNDLDRLEQLLREPCTPVDRGDARLLARGIRLALATTPTPASGARDIDAAVLDEYYRRHREAPRPFVEADDAELARIRAELQPASGAGETEGVPPGPPDPPRPSRRRDVA